VASGGFASYVKKRRGRGNGPSRGASQLKPIVLTLDHPIDESGKYLAVVRVEWFEDTFQVTDTGVHRPKVVKCMGSGFDIFFHFLNGFFINF